MKVLAAVVIALALATPAAGAQEPTTSTTLVEVPTRDIIPKAGSGEPPDDAGDRGGALQLAVLGLVLLAVASAVAMVVRQSRRARSGP